MQRLNIIATVILHIGLAWFAINLPMQIKWLPAALGMMLAGLGWFLLIPGWKKYNNFSFNFSLLLPISFYLLFWVGMLYSENEKKAGQVLELSLPLLIFPLLFFAGQAQKISHHLLRLFLGFSIVSAVITLIYMWINVGADNPEFTYRQFSPFEQIPSHYLAMYFSFSGGVFLLQNSDRLNVYRHIIPGFFLLSVSLLMNARVQIPVIAILLLLLLFRIFRDKAIQRKKKSFIVAFVFAVIGLVFLFPENQRRILETRDELRNIANIDQSKQTNHRYYLWDYAKEVIAENFWIGTGTGDANDKLKDAYQETDAQFWDGEKLYFLRDIGYNYHNQFLQSWAQNGIVALGLLLLMLITLLRKSYPAVKVFVLVISFSMLTESILERQAGVFFFAFMYCVLLFADPNSPPESSSKM
ncbi:MAG: O-antigen ligase family protein [Cryomorphaceae bacterium]|nr:O-antigen ligase family protein [Cryomorphaceae bacterium]